MKKKYLSAGLLAVLFVVLATVLLKRQALVDWALLYGYHPPQAVTQLATEDTMTAYARHLLYVNHPAITNSAAFTNHCPAGGEKTIVLGCYLSPDKGIYVYAVSDPRLNGVEQVTAAHEMLHAAYRRLSSAERTKVDAMLTDYYEHDLTDQRIIDTITAYKVSEPHDVVNEMHSVFGTEIATLPAPLEAYYRRYFTNRSKIAAYAAQYQAEFTTRQAKVQAYDTQLRSLKDTITTDEKQLNSQSAALSSERQRLDALHSSGQAAAYNAAVPDYNQAVDAYNSLLARTKSLIAQYNDIVSKRNALALEEQTLTKELTGSGLPSGT